MGFLLLFLVDKKRTAREGSGDGKLAKHYFGIYIDGKIRVRTKVIKGIKRWQ